MFYSQFVLAKKGPLGKIWLAAHMEKKVPKVQIISTNIPKSVEDIQDPEVPMALRVSGHLLLGVVRIFSRKVTYLLTDCSDALVKIQDAFRGPNNVEMAPGATTRRFDDITNPEYFDDFDLDADITSQSFTFSMAEDDALMGINIPDGALGELGSPEARAEDDMLHLDPAMEEEQEGFGHNENFEVFFEPQEIDEMPVGKRPRGSAAGEAPAEMDSREPELAEDLLEPEKFRFAENEDPFPPEGQLLLGENETIPTGAEFEPMLAPEFEEHEEMFPEGEQSGVDAVMSAGLGTESAAPDLQPAEKKRREKPRKAKRKMVMDEDLQITTAQMREQLSDTTNIIRDLSATSKEPSQAQGASSFMGPPPLPFLPADFDDLDCFYAASRPLAKRSRRESVRSDGGEEPEQWRSAQTLSELQADALGGGEAAAASGECAGIADPIPDQTMFVEEHDEPFDDRAPEMEFDAALLEQEPEMELEVPIHDEPEIPSFKTSHELPDVDSSETPGRSGRKNSSSQPSQGAAESGAWSKRTENMYKMLDQSFEESDGMSLSYDAMAATTQRRGSEKRRVVAGCFQELLFLATHGLVDLSQQKPYGNIVVSKTPLFDAVET